MGTDCKSVGVYLRRFESFTCHWKRFQAPDPHPGGGFVLLATIGHDGSVVAQADGLHPYSRRNHRDSPLGAANPRTSAASVSG